MSVASELNTVYTSLLYNLVDINEALTDKDGDAADTISDVARRIDTLPLSTTLANSIINNTIQTINSNVISVGDYKFYNNTELRSVVFSDVEAIGEKSFYGCVNMTNVVAPNVEYIGAQAFSGSGITNADFPELTEMKSGAFLECASLINITAPHIEVIEVSTFIDSTSLKKADFTDLKIINRSAFEGCTSLNTLILRGDTVVALRDINAFFNTPIRTGSGYIYVPLALVSAYKGATNWVSFSGKIRAIEQYPEVM